MTSWTTASRVSHFCFWYGTHEPHRVYEDGAGERSGKNPDAVELPSYYPDYQG